MIISQIAACSKNRVIGIEGRLPWDIPEDLKFFKDKTKGHVLIMGRKTFESLGQPLPNRLNIVVTRDKNFKRDGVLVFQDLPSALKYGESQIGKYPEEIFIGGGGEIYTQMLPHTDVIYLTLIHSDYKGDAFFPEVPEGEFELVDRKDRALPEPFSFLTYKRVKYKA